MYKQSIGINVDYILCGVYCKGLMAIKADLVDRVGACWCQTGLVRADNDDVSEKEPHTQSELLLNSL